MSVSKLLLAAQSYALFPTPIGHCGVAWSERGLTGVQLPEQDEAATRARMGHRFAQCSEAPAPPQVQQAMRAVVALLSGAPQAPVDLSNVMLDTVCRRFTACLRVGAPHCTG